MSPKLDTATRVVAAGAGRPAVLDSAHLGDIQGALGSVRQHDVAPRRAWRARLLTLLAIMGSGLIVMVGDNDAAASPPTPRLARTVAPACSGLCCCWCRSSSSTRKCASATAL